MEISDLRGQSHEQIVIMARKPVGADVIWTNRKGRKGTPNLDSNERLTLDAMTHRVPSG